jgi:ribosome assembly protein SQT1
MSEQQPAEPQGDVLNMEWQNEETAEMDDEFKNADNMVEIDIDDDDEEPIDSDEDEDGEAMGEPSDGEDPDDEFAGINDSLASVEHKQAVLAVAISPADKRVFVTGGQDDVAVLWALEETRFPTAGLTCVEKARLEGHTDSVNQVAFSHDGQYLATCSYDATIKIWTVATGALLHTLEGPAKELEWVIWHPKGHAILAGSMDTMAWMWWAPTGKLMQIFAGHAQGVSSGCWALGGKAICTGSEDRSVIVWNPRAGTPQQHIKGLHDSNVITMCSHPISPILVTGSEDAQVKVVHIETGKVIKSLSGHSESVEQVAFSNANAEDPHGPPLLLGTCSMDGRINIFDGKSYDTRCACTAHVDKGGVTGFKWFPVSMPHFLATAALDRTSRIFNALSGQCVHVLRGHTDAILDLGLMLVDAPDGTPNGQVCVISASDDNTCKVFVKSMLGDPDGSASTVPAATSVAPADDAARTLSAGYSPGAVPPAAPASS